jgi:hypothetical protein
MRSNKELLQVFLDNVDLFETGLCRWIMRLKNEKIISVEEENYIDGLIEQEMGFSFMEFMWTKGEIKPRLNWLKEKLTIE